MENSGEIATMIPSIEIVEFVGKLDHEFPQSLIVKHSDKADGASHLRDTEGKLKKNIESDQHLKLTNKCILKQESDLDIEIHRKHPLRQKILSLGRISKDDPLCKISVKFDDLWDHLVLETQEGTNSNFKVKFPNGIPGLQFWIVAEAHECDLRALNARINSTIEDLNKFSPIIDRLGSAGDVGRMFIEFGTAISGLNSLAKSMFSCIDVIYKHFKAQEESHKEMKNLAEGIRILASQLERLKEVPKSTELRVTISEFPGMMKEVVDFIEKWLKSWSAKHILVLPHKDKAVDLWKKLNAFAGNFDRDLLIDIRAEQAIMENDAKIVADDVKIIRSDIVNTQETARATQVGVDSLQENAKVDAEQKELDDLVRALGENRLSLRKPCMEGTRRSILQEIENGIQNVDGHNVIWIRGSPGVGKSALATSIVARLREQDRQVISFRFDRTKSATITTDALWRVVALGLARLYPSVRQHILNLVQNNKVPDPSDMNGTFKSLIEKPLLTLNDVPSEELPVIMIDALDECGGLRHDSSGKDDYKGLLYTLKHWIQINHLKRFKLIITSRPEDNISRIFPESVSTHIAIPSGSDVKLGDSTSEDIRTFLESRFNDMDMKPAWITRALDYLVPGAAGIFIWATTVANFLEDNPEVRFQTLRTRKGVDDIEGMDDLYSLYSTVVKASFGRISKREVQGIISVMGAMIYAKEPLNDDVLSMLPGVKIGASDILRLLRKGLTSVIDSDTILHFHHKSFEDYLLSNSFLQALPELSAVQDRGHHERQLAVLCLKALISPSLHFNICNLDSSIIKNVDIQPIVKSIIPPLICYSSLFWVDHLIQIPSDEKLKDAVKFVMYEKLLFWLEVMSLMGNVHEAYLILRRAATSQSLNPDNELTLFIHDAVRFVSTFFIPISQRTPHVYISALPFAPEESLVARKFCPRFPNTLAITQGKPSQWPMVEFTAEYHKDRVRRLVFSLDESTFASISLQTMYVCDSETGHCISGPFELHNCGNVYGACFSPDGKRILVGFYSYAVVWDIEMGEEQFQIEGYQFAFIRHDRRIVSACLVDGDWDGSRDESEFRILVQLWDASNGVLISDRLLEMNDVAITQFSPNGRFLAVGRKSEDVIELWNLEDGKDPQRFPYPPGNLSSLDFSLTSDTLMAVFREEHRHIYLWRLDTQEMVPFSHDFDYNLRVVHSPLTNYLFIKRLYTVEMWDVSMTSSEWIWETKYLANSIATSICPSRDGHRLLVGYESGSVRMWNVDLEDSTGNRAGTIDTQDDTATRPVITISPSGKVAATLSLQSYNVEFLDTNTWEVVARTDVKCEDRMSIAFSPDDNQAAILSKSLVTICDIMHPEECISFDPWPRKDVWYWSVTFQTCNDLVICAVFGDDSGLLQVWHRQDPPGFKCTYSLDLKGQNSIPYLAPDGLTVVIKRFSSSPTCYSWNHDTAQFDPVHFDDQVHILWDSYPAYSPDGKLFACWSDEDSHVRVWDTRTRQLVSKFPMSEVYRIALSPALIDHHLGDRLIALRFTHENTIRLFDAYNGHLYGQILGQEGARMAFIRDGTALAYYSDNIGLRTWEIADLTAEHQHSTDGLELMMQGMRDGWVMGQDDEPLFWVPIEHRKDVYAPPCNVMIKASQVPTILHFSNSRFGREWTECIDKEWLRELEKKEKEVGNMLE